MRKIILYTATSKDWFVAGPNGEIDWLYSIPETDYGYHDFYASLDITLMGAKTYRQVLGFDVPFPYPDTTNYVFTRNPDPQPAEHVVFVNKDILEFSRKTAPTTRQGYLAGRWGRDQPIVFRGWFGR